MRKRVYGMGVGWEHVEESLWWSVDRFQHRVGLEFIRQSEWWGNNRHSSSSPCEGQTVKRTTPHMLCPTKAFKAKHSLRVAQALTKAYTGHYEQQTISWGRHDITKGIMPTLWQYVRRSKPESIPVAHSTESAHTDCPLWRPQFLITVICPRLICLIDRGIFSMQQECQQGVKPQGWT